MKLVFLGPPGSGKGTYAQRLGPILKIPHIATGDILREAFARKTPEGIVADKYMTKGAPVSNEIMIKIIKDRLLQPDCKNGFIFDSPYNVEQAKEIDKIAKINTAINLVVPENVIIQRLSTRRICKECEAIYNLRTLKPKVEGKCDKCGGELYQRKDDTPEAIKERLKVYEKRAGPLIDYYRKKGILINIECNQVDIPPAIMVEKILKLLRKFK